MRHVCPPTGVYDTPVATVWYNNIKRESVCVGFESLTKSGLQLVALATRLNKHDASHGYREVQDPRSQGSPVN